jgi:hypothetical protein
MLFRVGAFSAFDPGATGAIAEQLINYFIKDKNN